VGNIWVHDAITTSAIDIVMASACRRIMGRTASGDWENCLVSGEHNMYFC
jgi:hypothetical protein